MNEISSSITIDTGVLVEYLEDSALGKKFKERNIPLYMKKEAEIDNALKNENFPAQIRLIDNL